MKRKREAVREGKSPPRRPKRPQGRAKRRPRPPKRPHDGPKTLQEGPPDIGKGSRIGMGGASWASRARRGGGRGRGKTSKDTARDLNTPMGRRPGELIGHFSLLYKTLSNYLHAKLCIYTSL